MGLIHDCKRCGHKACCHIFEVDLTQEEMQRLPYRKGTCYLPRRDDGACAFMTIYGTCAIYDRRPKACREWSCEQDPRWFELLDAWISGRRLYLPIRLTWRDHWKRFKDYWKYLDYCVKHPCVGDTLKAETCDIQEAQ